MEFNGFLNVVYKRFNREKVPVNGKSSYTFDDLKEWDQYWGFEIPQNVVVVDSDTQEESDILLQVIREKQLNCYISKSSRGYHFYFRIPTDLKIGNGVNKAVPIGLVDLDYRSGQKTSYIIECKDGKWNDWIQGPKYNETKKAFILDPYDLPELPYWLIPLKHTILTMVGMDNGSGRNNELFKHSYRLVDLGYSEDQVREVFNIINNFVFKEPLDEKELETLIKFDEKKLASAEKRWFDEKKGNFLHHEMALYMSQVLYAYKDGMNNIWYYDGRYYSLDTLVLEKKIAESCPILKRAQRQEVIDFMKLLNIESTIRPIENHYYFGCKNGLVNAKTGKLMGFNPGIFITSLIDAEYNANAYDEHVDKFLNDVLVKYGDKEQRMIFEEYLGYTLIARDNFMKKMMFCIGPNADNGKSTTLAMVEELLTTENYSALKLFEINAKNDKILTELVGKLANFDDDADSSMIKGSNMSYLKTLISDENKITINPKFKAPYKTFIRAKFWVASNHILKTEQKGDEWMTRLLILAFNNQFKGTDRDPTIKNKLRTESAKSYLLKLAVEGFQRLIKNNMFTESEESKKWIKQYRLENDSTYRFLLYKNYTVDDIDGKLVKTIYEDYSTYMATEEPTIIKSNINKLERRILEYYDKKIKSELIDNERMFKKILDTK